MRQTNTNSLDRLIGIRKHVEEVISKNRTAVGSGQTISEIEQELFSSLLELGKLLLVDRIESEESHLEAVGYEIDTKKK